jgi:pilus assembly protein CpaB
MMRKSTRRIVVLAALCSGALAALLAYLYLDQQRVWATEMTQPVQVVIAIEEIPARTVIEPGMVRETTLPAATLPANCAASLGEVMDRVTVAALAAKEPVRREAIAPQTASLGLAYVVPDGMRAVTVAVNQIIGVAGFLKAGDHVDVLATFDIDRLAGSNQLGVTRTILQDVELLAIGPEVRPSEVNNPSDERAARPKPQTNATLSVSPSDAEKLTLAEAEGTLRLSLRRAGDDRQLWLSGKRSDALIGLSATDRRTLDRTPRTVGVASSAGSARDTAKRPNTKTVETIRGVQRSTVDVRPK